MHKEKSIVKAEVEEESEILFYQWIKDIFLLFLFAGLMITASDKMIQKRLGLNRNTLFTKK